MSENKTKYHPYLLNAACLFAYLPIYLPLERCTPTLEVPKCEPKTTADKRITGSLHTRLSTNSYRTFGVGYIY